jgi:hypothetical protein
MTDEEINELGDLFRGELERIDTILPRVWRSLLVTRMGDKLEGVLSFENNEKIDLLVEGPRPKAK